MDAVARSFDDYQNWSTETALYPQALSIPYTGLGIGDEAGELLEKVLVLEARGSFGVHAGGYAQAQAVLAEGGDVLWYLARILWHRGISLGWVYVTARTLGPRFEATLVGATHEVLISSAFLQGRIKKEIRDEVHVPDEVFVEHAARIMRALEAIARALGSDLPAVAASNRAKLSDRKERGAIKGEGDTR